MKTIQTLVINPMRTVSEIAGATPTEKITTAVASAAATSPIWLDHLSGIAASLIPILGCLWLIIQIGGFVYKSYREDKRKDKDE